MKRKAIAFAAFFAAAGFAGSANALTITVDAFASADGTPITIGDSATPQYSFFDGTFLIYPANYIQGNNGATVSFPFYNGVPQLLLPKVATDIFGSASDGDYHLAFNIGTAAYTGLATVIGAGATQEITSITYDAVSTTPLPSSWGMMLLGLGVLGFLGYRQRAKMEIAVA